MQKIKTESFKKDMKLEKFRIIIFALSIILPGLFTQQVSKDGIKLSVQNKVEEEINYGDKIAYSLGIGSSAEGAQNINIVIALPPFVRFECKEKTRIEITQENDTNVVTIEVLESLTSGKEFLLNFSLVISDNNIEPGRHYVVTLITLNKKSSVQNSQTQIMKELHNVPIIITGCGSALGMTDERIKCYQLTSSSASVVSPPARARYSDDGDAWCANVFDQNQYIQVSFSHETKLTAISTKGRRTKQSWVTAYNILYSNDGKKWLVYSENGFPKKFPGNKDRATTVKNWFLYPFKANFIRIRPVEWKNVMCLRFELFGCEESKQLNCIYPLGMEDGRIPLEALSHNKITEQSKLNNVRLNKVTEDYPFGLTSSPSIEEWLQVDLGSKHKIVGIGIQGSYSKTGSSKSYVTSFQVQYSDYGFNWKSIMDEADPKKEKLYEGPSDDQRAAAFTMVALEQDVRARYIRILVLEGYVTTKFVRVELYGCMIEDSFAKQEDSSLQLPRRSVLVDESTNQMFACIYKKDRRRSSCHMSTDGKTWKSFQPNIVSVISKQRNGNWLFAINRDMQTMMSENLGSDWFVISSEELDYQLQIGDLINATSIGNKLPGNQPTNEMVWSGDEGHEWGVSGQGIHIRNNRIGNTNWRISALWNCCGN